MNAWPASRCLALILVLTTGLLPAPALSRTAQAQAAAHSVEAILVFEDADYVVRYAYRGHTPAVPIATHPIYYQHDFKIDISSDQRGNSVAVFSVDTTIDPCGLGAPGNPQKQGWSARWNNASGNAAYTATVTVLGPADQSLYTQVVSGTIVLPQAFYLPLIVRP